MVWTFHDAAGLNCLNLLIHLANMYGVSIIGQNSIQVPWNSVSLKQIKLILLFRFRLQLRCWWALWNKAEWRDSVHGKESDCLMKESDSQSLYRETWMQSRKLPSKKQQIQASWGGDILVVEKNIKEIGVSGVRGQIVWMTRDGTTLLRINEHR